MTRAGAERVARSRAFLNPPGLALAGAFVGLLLIGWGVGGIARVWAQPVDLDWVRDLAGDRTPALTTVSRVLSALGSGYVVFPLALAACLFLLTRAQPGRALAVLLCTFGAVALANLDKLLVGRPRPPVHHLERVSSASFPSGHATQSAGAYLALVLVLLRPQLPRRAANVIAAAAILLLLGVAFSRVYLGVHYPTDVAAGLLLGAAWVWAVVVAWLRPAPGTAHRASERGRNGMRSSTSGGV